MDNCNGECIVNLDDGAGGAGGGGGGGGPGLRVVLVYCTRDRTPNRCIATHRYQLDGVNWRLGSTVVSKGARDLAAVSGTEVAFKTLAGMKISKLRREKKKATGTTETAVRYLPSFALLRTHRSSVCVCVLVIVCLEPLSHTSLVLYVVFLEFYPTAIIRSSSS
jgi:hypothetical protein